jgi:SAM-dependent methyltransferase
MLSGCPFCHHTHCSTYREKQMLRGGGFCNILRCNECGILYPQARMDEKETKNYLSRSDCSYSPDLLVLEEPRTEFTNKNLIVQFLDDVAKTGRSLDIGTWSGKYTYIFQALGFDSYGLEPQKEAATFARNKGLKVLHGRFPNTIPSKLAKHKYRLIAMLEMLFYLHDLKNSLLKVKTLLDDQGVLLIQVHQGYSKYYDYKNSYFSRYGDYVQGIPTLDSLRHCLDKSGFTIIKVTGATEDSLQQKLDFSPVTMETADRLYVLARKAS